MKKVALINAYDIVMLMIRKILLVALAAVVVLGAGVAATLHYEKYQNKKSAEAQATQQVEANKVAEVKAAADAEYQALVGRFNALRAECDKGKVAYDQLPTYLKNRVPSPVCQK